MWTVYHGGGVCVGDVEMLCSESLSQIWCRKHKYLQPKIVHLHTQHTWGQECQSHDFPRLLVVNDWVRGWLSSRPTPTPWWEILPKDYFDLESLWPKDFLQISEWSEALSIQLFYPSLLCTKIYMIFFTREFRGTGSYSSCISLDQTNAFPGVCAQGGCLSWSEK